MNLIPLGTSAGRPTLSRGASALAVVTEGAWVLCDCGEGAQIAALRAGLSLSRLDAVLITHLHGDHFNGLPGLLGTLGLEGRQRPLVVAGPPGLTALLQHLERAGSLGTGDMEVRVLEQQGNGGEVRIEGSRPARAAAGGSEGGQTGDAGGWPRGGPRRPGRPAAEGTSDGVRLGYRSLSLRRRARARSGCTGARIDLRGRAGGARARARPFDRRGSRPHRRGGGGSGAGADALLAQRGGRSAGRRSARGPPPDHRCARSGGDPALTHQVERDEVWTA
ncbi:MAG: MBL fold metallo-hydrolase [Deltaproteobacteria bacterium]|nr:MAG: MBL fold metallo-hydrolase [Deltaproteobacteria bacterium]